MQNPLRGLRLYRHTLDKFAIGVKTNTKKFSLTVKTNCISMTMVPTECLQIIFCFIGFAIGRFGDKFGYIEKVWIFPVPHHWIWGVVFFILGVIFISSFWSFLAIPLGIGLFISDLNDFLHLRFFGKEPPHKWKFWSID